MRPESRTGDFRNKHGLKPLDWCRRLRNIPVSANAKLVGHMIAMHVNVGSHQAQVSVLRLAYETGTSKSTVVRAITELEEAGLLHCIKRGSKSGRNPQASIYQLSSHDEVRETSFEDWLAKRGLKPTGVTEELDVLDQESE